MKFKYLVNALLLLSYLSIYAQVSRNEIKGNKEYNKYAYIDVIRTYERLYESGQKSPEMLLKIGNAYYFNADLEKANKWYTELYESTPEQKPEFYFRYAQTLKSNKEYDKADLLMATFSKKNSSDSRAELHNASMNYLAEIKKNSGRYKIENAGIVNSKYSDYGTAFMDAKVVFSSARDTGNFTKRIHTWTGEYFTNLYDATVEQDGSLGSASKFGGKINTKFHEATPAFTNDGKTVYFTRNNYLDKKGYNSEKITLLKIYKATLAQDGQWTNITALPFCSDNYQTAHPALSPDGKTLYFASDMPGTLGLSDLYRVTINEDGSFGTVENLGDTINTEGRETYPFVSDENELYFASDGQLGLGGLDIFITKIPENGGAFKAPVNIGEEANSPKDDFAFIINTKTRRGFLSSNRDGGQGSDDIYKFLETKVIWCDQFLYGVVSDAKSQVILPNAKLLLFDEKFNQLQETTSDATGNYQFTTVECSTKYYLRASLTDYATAELPVIIGKETGKTQLNVELEKTQVAVKMGDDLADVFGINLIYFDLDKSNIRPDAAVDLAKILDVLEQYPLMKIDIRSHTDSRASFSYNEKLSERRAKSTMDWLVTKGINKDRLSAKGYGETQLTNRCADDVQCSEAEHQLNRRSQFIITSL